MNLDKINYVFTDGKGNFQMYEEKPETQPEGMKETTIDEWHQLQEQSATSGREALKATQLANYEAILKETGSPTTAKLVSGYDPEADKEATVVASGVKG